MKPPRDWKEMIADWAPELSKKLGRPVEQIISQGIGVMDFSPSKFVEIRELSKVTRFGFAFALVRPEEAVAALFHRTQWLPGV